MFTAKQFRAKAAESAESLKHTDVPSEIRELQRSKQSFSALAENEASRRCDALQLRETEVLHLTEAVNGLTAHLRKYESGPSATAST
jgi:hypothetical protein